MGYNSSPYMNGWTRLSDGPFLFLHFCLDEMNLWLCNRGEKKKNLQFWDLVFAFYFVLFSRIRFFDFSL